MTDDTSITTEGVVLQSFELWVRDSEGIGTG